MTPTNTSPASGDELRRKLAALPWREVEAAPGVFTRYVHQGAMLDAVDDYRAALSASQLSSAQEGVRDEREAFYEFCRANRHEASQLGWLFWVGRAALAGQSKSAAEPYLKALDIRIEQGWQLGGNACPVLYTDTINGEQVCRDDLWIATTAGLKSAAPVEPPNSIYDHRHPGHNAALAAVEGLMSVAHAGPAWLDEAMRLHDEAAEARRALVKGGDVPQEEADRSRATRQRLRAFLATPAAVIPEAPAQTEEPVLWWNGIRSANPDEGEARSIDEVEGTWHDIPLFAGCNPHSGYVEAFYELAKLMGLGAQTISPAQVWREQMLPQLREALASPAPVQTHAGASEVIQQTIDAMKPLYSTRAKSRRYEWLSDRSGLDLRTLLGVGDFTSLDSHIDKALTPPLAQPGDDTKGAKQ
ncbi:hypothetical protein J7E70_01900 [Variovorax paradoxus]|nr:hypothetical protein [Variovorax paradoxus]MBT2299208.1 hypothetical protein [Variovorax paradoxus]